MILTVELLTNQFLKLDIECVLFTDIALICSDKSTCVIQVKSYEPGHAKMCLMPYANNIGADQPAHPRSLISAFVVRFQDRMIALVYISEISRF